MKILVDTNILIDYIANRHPFSKNAEIIIELCKDKKVEGCVAAHSLINIFYILRKSMSVKERKELLLNLSQLLSVVGVDREKILASINNDEFTDFEDCLQYECAKSFSADWIVTRNIKDFKNSSVKPISPEQFLSLINEKKY